MVYSSNCASWVIFTVAHFLHDLSFQTPRVKSDRKHCTDYFWLCRLHNQKNLQLQFPNYNIRSFERKQVPHYEVGQTKTHKSRLGLTEGKSFLLVSHQNRSVKLGFARQTGKSGYAGTWAASDGWGCGSMFFYEHRHRNEGNPWSVLTCTRCQKQRKFDWWEREQVQWVSGRHTRPSGHIRLHRHHGRGCQRYSFRPSSLDGHRAAWITHRKIQRQNIIVWDLVLYI